MISFMRALFFRHMAVPPGRFREYAGAFWALAAAMVCPVLLEGFWVLFAGGLPPAPVFLVFVVLSLILFVLALTWAAAVAANQNTPAPGTCRASWRLIGAWALAALPGSGLMWAARTLASYVVTPSAWPDLAAALALFWAGLVAFYWAAAATVLWLLSGGAPLARAYARAAGAAVGAPGRVLAATGIFAADVVVAAALSAVFAALARLLVLSVFLRLELCAAAQGVLFAGVALPFVLRAARLVLPLMPPAGGAGDLEGVVQDGAETGDRSGAVPPAPAIRVPPRFAAGLACALAALALAAWPFAPSFALVPWAGGAVNSLFQSMQAERQGAAVEAENLARRALARSYAALAYMDMARGRQDADNVLKLAAYADPRSGTVPLVRALASLRGGDRQTAEEYAVGAISNGNPEGWLILARASSGMERRRCILTGLVGAPYLPLYAPPVPTRVPFDGFGSQAAMFGRLRDAAVAMAVYAAGDALAAGRTAMAYALACPLQYMVSDSAIPGTPTALAGQVHAILGAIEWKIGDPAGAVADFAKSVSLSPGDAPWMLQAETGLLNGLCLPGASTDNAAVRTALRAADRPSASPELVLAAGGYRIAQRQWQQAVETLSRVAGPDRPMAEAETALAYYEARQDGMATDAASRALANNPPADADAVAHSVLGLLAAEKGDQADAAAAVRDFTRVVQLQPYDFVTWVNLGNEYMVLKQNARAAEAYSRALVAYHSRREQGPFGLVVGNPGEGGGMWSPSSGDVGAEIRADLQNALGTR